ncbi:sugar ABC transporter substrate-binding protein [Actinomadura sp. WMMB 499]|uniref:sugar ABC transporter substrate-binding protein n=1 Tax=Actinomadura sp. WMMB 499 TaxID=1219491 RepID=UPI001244B16F|nr:sugar ABC transporter substrate-binding protein [Actinomadura sp. WMMB 499]QFG26190.1 sugar ABC transporter substrate-binding protein [Actinomadura sp. WMMB 499]
MARRQTLAAAAAALAMAALAAGCGQAGESEAAADKGELTVGVSTLGQSFPFPAAVTKGIKAEAERLGVEIIEVDAQGQAQKQSSDIQDLIGQAPDGVLLLPVDSGVAAGMADNLKRADIPTVAVASQVGDPKSRDLTDVYPGLVALATQDEYAAGRTAGELALEVLPDGGEIAVVEGAAGFAETHQRYRDFEKPAEEKGVELKVVARQPGDWLPEKAQSACQNMLAAHPGVELFYAESDDMGVGCAKAVEAAGSDAAVIGVGGSKLGIDGVKSGDLYGTVCYKPEDLGARAMKVLHEQLTGAKKYDAEFVTYETPAITEDNVGECAPQW